MSPNVWKQYLSVLKVNQAYGRRYRKGFSGSNISSNLCMKLPYKIQVRVMREIYRFD